MTRRVLYLDQHRLTAYHWSGNAVVKEDVFEPVSADHARFAAYLGAHAGSRFYLLANTPEEGYQQETIPFLQGNNRQVLIRRKLSQHFFATPLTAARSMGFEKDRRKNEKLLLTALTNPAHFELWVQAIQRAEVALAGIFTPAQLSGPLLSRLQHDHERCLLLTLQDNSIRESFVVDGVTLFSRTAPLNDSSHAGMAATLAAEAGKLHQYLLGQRLIGRNEHLNAYVLAHPLAAPAIRNSCIDSGGLSFRLLDNQAAAAQLGLKTPPQDSRAESIFVHLLVSRPPSQQYAPPELRRDFRLAQTRTGLYGFALAAIIVALGFTGIHVYRAMQADAERAQLIRQQAELEQGYQAVMGTFPQVDASNEEVRQVTARYTELQGSQQALPRFYRQLARAVDAHPVIEIDSIEWKRERGAPGSNAGGEIADIKGQVRLPGNATPRQIIAGFSAFSQALRENAGFSVTILQAPFDIESGRALKGSGREEETLKQHPFALRIEQKVRP